MSVVEVCKPKDLLYIAVDGVAPRAKIQQQRRRRYMSAYRNAAINDFKKSNDMPVSDWDSNCITPGTEFMEKLDSFLRAYFANTKTPFKTIVSGHSDKGEGEHKIVQYIKSKSSNEVDVIYGLDADLIMLSLSCEKNNIYLMRESTEFVKNISGGMSTVTKQLFFKYLNIDGMRKCVALHLYNSEDLAYMYDYIVICFLLGNDFIPNVAFLKIRNGAIDVVCDAYKKVFNETKLHLITKSETGRFYLNSKVLFRLFEVLSKVEDACMKEAIEQHETIVFNPHKRFQNKIDRFIYQLESHPLIHRHPDVICPHTDNKWRVNYYHYLFGSFASNVVKNVTINYIEGLVWTSNYYFNMEYDMNWYYEYDYGPCMSDLYKYMLTMDEQKVKEMQDTLTTTSGPEIDKVMQMLMVLPAHSKEIVPQKFRLLYSDMNKGCVHFYPLRFVFSCFLKTQLWECSPILPKIDLAHLHKCIAVLTS
jgi:5'-3' exoribonuclease 1